MHKSAKRKPTNSTTNLSPHAYQGRIQDFFKGGLGANRYIIYKNYIAIHCNYSHYYFNQQSACKYLLHVHEAVVHTLLFLQLLCTNVTIHLHGRL